MINKYIDIQRTSYLQNIKNTFGGIVFGIILFICSFILLWWNEGNAVRLSQKENFITENITILSSTTADRNNDERLIMVKGTVFTDETLSDATLSVNNALNLKRIVEMYQWIENESTQTKNNLGGSTTQTTTYSYEKKWSSQEHNSNNFHNKEYENPKFTIHSGTISANNATLGDFTINHNQISKIKDYRSLYKLTPSNQYQISDKYYYQGNDPENPEIGDIRISYKYVPSGIDISIIGKQNYNNTITEMPTKSGEIYIQYDGNYSYDEMINQYKNNNKFLTKLLRVAGWLLMYVALLLLINPINVLLQFIPILSKITNAISSFLLLGISFALSIITIAIAWLAYKPLISIALFMLVFAIFHYYKQRSKNQKTEV